MKNTKKELVGKICLEVWEGAPDSPGSQLKTKVVEYNTVHPEALLDGSWTGDNWVYGATTHPITGKTMYSSFDHLELCLGLTDDPNDVLKFGSGCGNGNDNGNHNQSRYSGKVAEMVYCKYNPAAETLWAWGDADLKYELSEKNKKYTEQLIVNSSTPYQGYLVPMLNRSFGFCGRLRFTKRFNPFGVDFTIKNIGIYGRGHYKGSDYCTFYGKGGGTGFTFHKFEKPLDILKTDYIKLSYHITVKEVTDVIPPTVFRFKDKYGEQQRAIRIPMGSANGYNNLVNSVFKSKMGADKEEADKEGQVYAMPRNAISTKDILGSLYGMRSLGGGHFLTVMNNKTDNSSSNGLFHHTKGFVPSSVPKELLEEYSEGVRPNRSYIDFIRDKLFGETVGEIDDAAVVENFSNLPIILVSNYHYHVGALSTTIDTSGNYRPYKTPVKISLKLNAVDNGDVNRPIKALASDPFTHLTFDAYGGIIYLTIFETPQEKTKFDEAVFTDYLRMTGGVNTACLIDKTKTYTTEVIEE